jgi:hypothetical protein
MLLILTSVATVVWLVRAMPNRVSPAFTTYSVAPGVLTTGVEEEGGWVLGEELELDASESFWEDTATMLGSGITGEESPLTTVTLVMVNSWPAVIGAESANAGFCSINAASVMPFAWAI